MRASSRQGATVILSLLVLAYSFPAGAIEEFRSADGSWNNLKDPLQGSAGQVLRRNLDANFQYRDELLEAIVDLPTTEPLPVANLQTNPRTISNILSASSNPPKNDRNNLLETFFGQFVNHDKEDTKSSNSTFFAVPIYGSDELYDQTQSKPNRLLVGASCKYFDYGASPQCETFANGVVEEGIPSFASSWLDLSTVYGSSDDVMNHLRSFEGGRLKTATYTLRLGPFASATYSNELPSQADCDGACPQDTFFVGSPSDIPVSGDGRAGENVALTLMHTLYHREHNRLADALAGAHPDWDDEQIFQEARKLNIAQYQRTIFEEYLPEVLRGLKIPKYTGYKKNTEGDTSIEFATGAFRYGHSTTAPYRLLDENRCPFTFTVPGGVFGPSSFTDDKLPFAGQLGGPFTPPQAYLLAENGSPYGDGPENIVRSLVNEAVDEPDLEINDVLRNIRAVGLSGNGIDLMVSDIVRGRETGLPSYYELRKAFYTGSRNKDLYKAKGCDEGAIDSIECFLEINSDPDVAYNLQDIYGKVTAIDGVIGLLAEDKEDSTEYLPRTSANIILDEYLRSRDADRFWYEQKGYLPPESVALLHRFVDILRDNFPALDVEDNPFVLPADAGANTDPDVCFVPSAP
jgi:hypothetical protein